MSYTDIKAAVQTVAEGATGFTKAVAYEDYALLSSGVERALVISYDGFTDDYFTFGPAHSRKWSLKMEMYTAFTDVVNAQTLQDADREYILAAFAKYPNLNACPGVLDANIVSGMPEEDSLSIGQAKFLKETYTLAVWEDVASTALE